ncbi:unnamed protein product [Linum trigynum]|uniref:Uncharacterized protein n=1 Tax=Linum trigynum TaxID=586398 RepID=A0AAV2DHN2_9ROSI
MDHDGLKIIQGCSNGFLSSFDAEDEFVLGRHAVNKFHEEQTAQEAIAAEEEGEGEKEDEGQVGQMSKYDDDLII